VNWPCPVRKLTENPIWIRLVEALHGEEQYIVLEYLRLALGINLTTQKFSNQFAGRIKFVRHGHLTPSAIQMGNLRVNFSLAKGIKAQLMEESKVVALLHGRLQCLVDGLGTD